ncbi:MAG: MATE family efflux transporter [Muribaculaceae bacterium]|nr:MATE family efflux transporter [Muribaculaceae bacterium]
MRKGLRGSYKADYAAVLKLGLPILIGQLGMIVVGFADNIMVGRYSTEALASASFVNNLFNVAIFACVGFSYGLTPLVGALFTQNRYRAIGSLLRAGVFLNTLFALVVTAVMWVLYLMVDRLGQPDELLPLIRPYFRLYLAGLLPVALFNVFAQWAYGINRTAMPMWIILGANVVNLIGNYMLIYGNCGCPELGLYGAGLSTLAARWLCPVVIAGVFLIRRCYRGYRDGFVERVGVTVEQLRRVFGTSMPVSLQLAFESGSFSFAAVMAGWLGAVSLAAFQVIVITGTLGFCVYYSIGSAVSVLVANASGLADRAGMRRVAFAGYHIIMAMATVSSVIFIIFGSVIIKAFTDDPAVLLMASSLIFPLVLYQYADATQINFANALRGTSHVMPMLWIAFVSYVVIGVPATYLIAFPGGLGTYGIILSFSVSLIVAAVLFLWFFLKNTRRQ